MSFLRRLLVVGAACVTTLTIPGVASAAGSDGTARDHTYTVVAGDSLYGIAYRHGVPVGSLMAANGLAITSVILPGQQLNLPAGATTPTTTTNTTTTKTNAATTTSHHTYTVVAGDSLYGIAYRHGVSPSSLMAANGLAITSVILPGQQLNLPAGATTPTTTTNTTTTKTDAATTTSHTYTVVAGDSLYGIAYRHGVSPSSLMAANGLAITSVILPGQQLNLPAGATTPTTASSNKATPSTGNANVDVVVSYARAQLGKPYAFFTRGPDTFDCSGLTAAAYSQAGITLVHYSASQALQGTVVDLEHDTIRAGDLLFFKRHGANKINHVGIAVSPTTWIQATGPGDAVRLGSIPPKSTISAVRRLIDA